jgi:hypothetical protein
MRCTIKIPIYHTSIDFRVVKDIGKCYKRIYKVNNYTCDDCYNADGLMFFFERDKYYLLLKLDALRHGLIAHELLHIIDEIKLHHSLSGGEDTARLLEYCTDAVYKFFYDKGFVVWV